MPTLYPTDPQDWLRTEAERKDKNRLALCQPVGLSVL